MLYTPKSTGTVISPEHIMKDMQRFNPQNKIFNWSQNGVATRSVQWKDKEGRIFSSLQMEERNSLYYIKNTTLLPPPKPSVQSMTSIVAINEASQPDETATEDIDAIPRLTADERSTSLLPIQVETVTPEEETVTHEDRDMFLTQHSTFMGPIVDKTQRPSPPAPLLSDPQSAPCTTPTEETVEDDVPLPIENTATDPLL
jgi:hypothetical protein